MQGVTFRTCAHAAVLAALMLATQLDIVVAQEFAGRDQLRAHSNQFRKEVIAVTDRVNVAVGYSASNVVLIHGDGGSIIIDTASNPEDATRENIAVWLPDDRVLMSGDDFYRAFPNLSPIRGTRLRPPEVWIASLDKMIDLDPEYLIPGHMRRECGR